MAGLLTLPFPGAFPSRASGGTVAVDIQDVPPQAGGITATGIVPDLHRIPF